MTVTLNEVALRALLETEQGPVGRDIRRRAEEVTEQAQRNVRFIMGRATGIDPSQSVGFSMQPGPQAIVGIRPRGRPEEYLDEKAAREDGGPGDWMRNALRAVFSD